MNIAITRTFFCKKGEEEIGIVFEDDSMGRRYVRFGAFENEEFHNTEANELLSSLPRSRNITFDEAVESLKEDGFEIVFNSTHHVQSEDLNDYLLELCDHIGKKVPWYDNGDVE